MRLTLVAILFIITQFQLNFVYAQTHNDTGSTHGSPLLKDWHKLTENYFKKSVTPDSYQCKPDNMNICEFHIHRPHSGGCTEIVGMGSAEITERFEKCKEDWRYSDSIHFQGFSDNENACVNYLRNNIYKEGSFKLDELGMRRAPGIFLDQSRAHAICLKHHRVAEQKDSERDRLWNLCHDGEWKKFIYFKNQHDIVDYDAVTRKLREISATEAHTYCSSYFKDKKEYGFSDQEWSALLQYLNYHQFPCVHFNPPTETNVSYQIKTEVRGKLVKNSEILKDMFEFYKKRGHDYIVTQDVIDKFERDYELHKLHEVVPKK